ncbi:dienelactone hydrolase family protein [Parvibium lacunae]|nr:dienelactone hydrolase family protein [Parvibium lacunae]
MNALSWKNGISRFGMSRLCNWKTALLLLTSSLSLAAIAQPSPVSLPSQRPGLQAYWFPAPTSTTQPTLIMLHGCSGTLSKQGRLTPDRLSDATLFNQAGIHLLVLDSFSGRGIKSICELARDFRPINERDRRQDVIDALVWLKQQPGVGTQFAVLGRSHGGQTVLTLLSDALAKQDPNGVEVLANLQGAIALYPGCRQELADPHYRISHPLLMLTGALDDWTAPAPCAALHQKLRERQPEMRFDYTSYADSYHGFDGTAPLRVRSQVANTRSGQATVGGNPLARQAAYDAIFSFLEQIWQRPLSPKPSFSAQ